MRSPVAVAAAVATTAAVMVAGSTGSASADLTLPSPSLSPLPTVSVEPLPTETPLPLPSTSVSDPTGTLPGTGSLPGTGDGGSTADGTGPDAGGSSTAGTDDTFEATGATASAAAGSRTTESAKDRLREKRARDATPVIAGTPQATDLLDDEDSPQLQAAGQAFLAADRGIAEIARQKRVMARLQQEAAEQAQLYRALGADVLTAQTAAESMHERYDSVRHELVAGARTAYVTGQPTTDDGTATGLAAAATRLRDGSTRADLRWGVLTARREAIWGDFERLAARYAEVERRLEDANQRLAALAAQRSDALQAVRAAKGGDVALHRARLAESGQLGAQVRAASDRLERSGETVQGTGDFRRPLDGQITSAYGMRFHPILHYTKLHTGTDLAGGDSVVRAADDGRVIMTVVSSAYGNFTVIDHGVIDGKRVTTAYAHQAQFLVEEGQEVRRGQQIGIVGSTGYSTGPHLHFEVREDGAVVDPMSWF